MAKPYRRDIDFAFFAVNFGYSKSDYDELTPREIHFIYKAWESKMVSDSYNLYNAVFTAVYNANRPKGKKALKLWRKSRVQKANMEIVNRNTQIVMESQKNDGNWIAKIYGASNIPIKGCEGNG